MNAQKGSEIKKWLDDGLKGYHNGFIQDLVCAVELATSNLEGKIVVDEAELRERLIFPKTTRGWVHSETEFIKEILGEITLGLDPEIRKAMNTLPSEEEILGKTE